MTERDASAPIPGYYDSPWPGEDGGPRRQMAARDGTASPALTAGESLRVTSRAAQMACMPILRAPGEIFIQGNTPPSPEGKGWVERVHPESLETVARSPDLDGGPFWPGGMLAHANGDLYVTFGRWCHRLDPDCAPIASRELLRAMPYNSLVALSDGNLVMKNFVRDGSSNSYFTLLEPDRLEMIAPEIEIPEGSIARISRDIAGGREYVYVVGDHTFYRYAYAAGSLDRDESWEYRYRTLPDAEQSYGWDPVIAGGSAWFLDNGHNVYRGHFRGGGVASSPIRLHRVSTTDAADIDVLPPFDAPHGTVANPPLVDPSRNIVVAFDSGNARIAGFRYNTKPFTRLWDHAFGAGNHFILYTESGEIAVNDHDGTDEHLVILDIETGAEKARVPTGSKLQSVVFQAPGWNRDVYTCTFTTLSRAWIE